jgi:hypothetical protein
MGSDSVAFRTGDLVTLIKGEAEMQESQEGETGYTHSLSLSPKHID